MADTFKPIQTQQFTLAGAGSAIGATSIILSSMATIDGVAIAMTDIGSIGYFTIEPGNGTQEEAGTFTGITQNVNGTATLTGVKHQLFEYPYTQASGLTKSHAGGTNLILSNTAGFYESISGKANDETVTGIWTFTAPNYPRMNSAATPPVTDAEFATKKYVDDTAIAGSPKATNSVYGISKLSSAAADPTAPVVLNNEEVSATSAANKVVKANSSGKIDKGFIEVTADKGLEFSTNALQAKAGTAIVLNSSGINVDVGTTASKIVQLDGSAKLPAVDGSQLTNVGNPKVGATTYDLATASGTQNIAHGLGKTPKYVRIDGAVFAGTGSSGQEEHGFTIYNGTTQTSISTWKSGNPGYTTDANFRFSTAGGAGDYATGVVTFDATNIIITWTKTGSASGTLNMTWMAI